MSSFYQSIVKVISKPSEKRDDEEINMILDWFMNLFKKKAAVFGDIKPEVVKDIIKNCAFETKKPDEIVIRQGDVGDCFYINLRGKVSIYINHKKHDENDTIDDVPAASKATDETGDHGGTGGSDHSKSKKLRERLGNFVTSLGSGEGFGEVALVSDELRTASIICDEMTDLVIVNKALYNRSLHASTLRKLHEKQNFINKSPFFGNWAPKMKKLLSLCLERDIIPYDSYLGKQGEAADRIYFIINGQAKVTVNPTIHSVQYPRFYPLKLPENESKEIISSWMDEKNGHSTLDESKLSKAAISKHALLKRRNVTFAQAEQQLKTRCIEVGILGPGEICGMCEILFDMPTFMQSTKCLEDCDVYYIYKRSYERLIAKRNPTCINKMKENVLMKLGARNSRLRSSMPIDLFRSLEYVLQLSTAPRNTRERTDEPKSTSPSTRKSGPMLPHGPIIQSNIRPKSAAYRRMVRLAKQYKERVAQNAAAKLAPNSVSSLLASDNPVDDAQSKIGTNRSSSNTVSDYSNPNSQIIKIVPIIGNVISSQSQLSSNKALSNKASLSQLGSSNNSTFNDATKLTDDYYHHHHHHRNLLASELTRKTSAATASSLPQIVADLNSSNPHDNPNNSSISNEFYSSSESYDNVNHHNNTTDFSMTTAASGTNNSNNLGKNARLTAAAAAYELSDKITSIFESNPVQDEVKPKDKGDEALALLESRMKRWHLELGEKKPVSCVTKLHRVDYDKLSKNDTNIKGTTAASFSRVLLNPNLEVKINRERSFVRKQHNLSTSGDSESVSTNSPDLNSPLGTPENEQVDLGSSFSNYMKLSSKQQQTPPNRFDTRLYAQRDSSSLGYSASPKTAAQFSDTDGENLSNKEVASDSSSDGSTREETDKAASLLKFLTSDNDTTKRRRPSLVRQHSVAVLRQKTLAELSPPPPPPANTVDHRRRCELAVSSSILTKQQLLAHNQMKLGNLDRKFSLPAAYKTSSDSSSESSEQQAPRRIEQKRGSLQLAFPPSHAAAIESTVQDRGDNSSNALKHDKKRKKSLPGQQFENASNNNSDELVPYIIRRKFSNGQVKIQHSGKKYTKEEYNALKIELKKQSRRFSITSSIHA